MLRIHYLLTSLAIFAVLLARLPQRTSTVHVNVVDGDTGRPIPCRITLTDEKGNLARTHVTPRVWLASRRGVVYSSRGQADIGLASGHYTVYATRGLAYSLAKQDVEIKSGEMRVLLKLTKEVDVTGYVSCDTHIHTLTHSGHGDCTESERLVTLAGEGIELPIATEHNLAIKYPNKVDFADPNAWYTPVVGDEVTTAAGHFNVFPLDPSKTVPDYHSMDWKATLASMRSHPEARFVILNHPTDLHSDFRPSDLSHIHPVSGESEDGRDWDFDGIEVINSGAVQSDEMSPFRVWFALLNRGKRITAIGASDSHDVNLFIVGQGRTYIKSTSKSPDHINTAEVFDNLRDGRAIVSMGLLCEASVEDRFGPGDLAVGLGGEINVHVKARGPKWVTADRIELFSNGELVAARSIVPGVNAITKADLTFRMPRPRHDVWLTAIATGPGVREPFWPISRPYQPERADWEPRLVACSGVVRVDGDGDGKFSSPRDYALSIAKRSSGEVKTAIDMLEGYDAAVAVQTASALRERGVDLRSGPAQAQLASASPAVVQAFKAYLRWLPK